MIPAAVGSHQYACRAADGITWALSRAPKTIANAPMPAIARFTRFFVRIEYLTAGVGRSLFFFWLRGGRFHHGGRARPLPLDDDQAQVKINIAANTTANPVSMFMFFPENENVMIP
jgi:hypothetical protein